MLLVHYMHRRALFSERISYARKAAEAASRLGQKLDEALFRIDALAWTLIEAGGFPHAEEEIMRGLQIAKEMDTESTDVVEVIALGHAFLARAYMHRGDIEAASQLIDDAMSVQSRPVIAQRVTMMAGELAYVKGHYEIAIRWYHEAIRYVQEYGGDLQAIDDLHYRLGSCYLAQSDVERAKAEFQELSALQPQTGTVPFEGILGNYGLAQVAKAEGQIEEARRLAGDTLEGFSRLGTGHRLIKEVQDFLASLDLELEASA
jgi:tetratricopeptide (TPR) repeat protein